MHRRAKALLVAAVAFVGALLVFALTVYPFQYGLAESLLLACAFVGVVLFETLLDDTSFCW